METIEKIPTWLRWILAPLAFCACVLIMPYIVAFLNSIAFYRVEAGSISGILFASLLQPVACVGACYFCYILTPRGTPVLTIVMSTICSLVFVFGFVAAISQGDYLETYISSGLSVVALIYGAWHSYKDSKEPREEAYRDEEFEEVEAPTPQKAVAKSRKLIGATIALSILLVIALAYFVHQYNRLMECEERIASLNGELTDLSADRLALQEEIASLNRTTEAKDKTLSALKKERSKLIKEKSVLQSDLSAAQRKASYWDRNIGMYTKAGDVYHKAECKYMRDVGTFYYNTISELKRRGYAPCSICRKGE